MLWLCEAINATRSCRCRSRVETLRVCAQLVAKHLADIDATVAQDLDGAADLAFRLAWRGIRGFPLTGYDPSRLH